MLSYRNIDHNKVSSHRKLFCHYAGEHLATGIDLERVFLDDDVIICRSDVCCTTPDNRPPDFQGHTLDFCC